MYLVARGCAQKPLQAYSIRFKWLRQSINTQFNESRNDLGMFGKMCECILHGILRIQVSSGTDTRPKHMYAEYVLFTMVLFVL